MKRDDDDEDEEDEKSVVMGTPSMKSNNKTEQKNKIH